MDSIAAPRRIIHPQDKKHDILKCPTCNTHHHARTDVFGNLKENSNLDFDAREIFGLSGVCPICLEDCSSLVALPCGHILCKADYVRLGGHVISIEHNDENESPENVILNIHRAGAGNVNGTYRYDSAKDRYTRLSVWDGKDAEFAVETRALNGRKMWFLTCRVTGSDELIDFYKAQVLDSNCYPSQVQWRSVGMSGVHPLPKVEVSYFE
ncbi:hypothetical protein ACHAWO_005899 [Cyclotella atomus]|uniref:RING-type domain-containing protein n=1 Tax=Cyclotella atomus TaxID=382360 RepID=A0ABD3MPL8_9STRA